MLSRPEIADERLVAGLHRRYGLRVARVAFLPVGADVRSAAFRVVAEDGAAYFLKLRRGRFAAGAAEVPAFLHSRGVRRVMAPLATITGRLWARADGFAWLLYPYFDGSDGFTAPLSRAQWVALGESMRAVHATALPAALARRLPREGYGPRNRTLVRALLRPGALAADADPIAAGLAALWSAKRDEIAAIVERAERLARALRRCAPELVPCHGDLHAGNVLVGAGDALAIVDWDEPVLAPKERDLMFVGGGVGGVWDQANEAAWFYEGYGRVAVDPVALAYYRYERIVADLAAYAEQIFGARGSAEDRAEGLRQLAGQFRPGGVVEIARRSDPHPV